MTDEFSNAENSICPAGWRLPVDRNADSWIEGNEIDMLVSSIDGIVDGLIVGDDGSYVYRNFLADGFNRIRTASLWLARSGNVYGGTLYNIGQRGSYYSSTVKGSDKAYSLGFYIGIFDPASSSGRSNGISVRCLAEQIARYSKIQPLYGGYICV